MDQSLRSPLKTGDRLRLTSVDGGDAGNWWEITGFSGAGGASLCYTAKNGTKSGRLKEFYPADSSLPPLFTRCADGYLRQNRPAAGAACEEFLRAYELLEQVKHQDPSAEILNNFIPPYLLLRSGADGTVYVWTPDDKQGITFETYLQDSWKKPQKAPEHKLYNILSVVITLTDCMRAFHRTGLLHLDIKPSNFLVLYDGAFNINPDSISLFDVNTIGLAGSAFRAMGSEGYCAPEVPRGRADNRSDLYSIGAMLFRAIIGRCYQKRDYELLDRAVAASELICASESNSNVFLRYVLGKVLKKCLVVRPAERYSCCEELLTDLKRARTFLLPEVASDQLGWQKKLAILDTEPQENCSPAAVMHDLLFRDPPDAHLQSGEDTIRVLVVGAGTYGQKFIDICLQSCQLLDKKLHIIAVSQDPELDREVYFQTRPALPAWLDQGGDGEICLTFRPLTFGREDTPAALDALLDAYQNAPVHYIFISLGEDERNAAAAALLAKATTKRNMACSVHYVVRDEECAQNRPANPVWINKPIHAGSLDPRLKQMAWNTHLIWAEGTSESKAALRREFRKKYNLEASLAYALSVSGKLRSVGIYEKDPQRAAEEFSRRILRCPDAQFDRLVALEHRRWVLEKATSGWQPPRKEDGTVDLESGIARGEMKDKIRKTHPCMVSSTAAAPLRAYTKDQWDNPNHMDDTLDQLDLLSVTQHRLCLAAAKKLAESQPLRWGELPLIRQRLAGAPETVIAAFEDYALCLMQILNGSYRAAKELDRYETNFRGTFPMLRPALRRELNGRLRQVRMDFFPAIEAALYRDYKRQDELLIRQIPFVLTGTVQQYQDRALLQMQETVAATAAPYEPKPVDTAGVCLLPELLALTEQIAANIHDVWARNRLREGWSYGELRNDEARTTPCLVPYEDLPDSEKAYDRNTALQTLKLIIKLGYRIQPPEED